MTAYKPTLKDISYLFKLVIPIMTESLINMCFGIADTAMLGKSDGAAAAIAAVGVAGPIIDLFISITAAFCIGVTACIAQSYGAKDFENCKKITAHSVPLLAAFGLISSLVLVIFAPQLMKLQGANKEVFGNAVTYFRIVGAGCVFHFITIAVTAAFRGIGQSKLPMVYNLAAGAINVFFNYCLINGNLGFSKMGVAGAAIATTLAKIIICALSLILLFKLDTAVKPSVAKGFKFKLSTLKPVVSLGSASAAEQMILRAGNIVSTMIISALGTASFAAFNISAQTEGFDWAIAGAFCAAATTIAGMAKGEGKPEKAFAMTKVIWCIALVFALATSFAYYFLGGNIASLYTNDKDVITHASQVLKVFSLITVGTCTHNVFAGAMRGMGYSKYPMLASLATLWVFKVFGSFIFATLLGYGVTAVAFCCVADQTVRGFINIGFFNRLKKRTYREKQSA